MLFKCSYLFNCPIALDTNSFRQPIHSKLLNPVAVFVCVSNQISEDFCEIELFKINVEETGSFIFETNDLPV